MPPISGLQLIVSTNGPTSISISVNHAGTGPFSYDWSPASIDHLDGHRSGNITLGSLQSLALALAVTDAFDGRTVSTSLTVTNTYVPYDEPDAPTDLMVSTPVAGTIRIEDWMEQGDGGSPITSYDAQYKLSTSSDWTEQLGIVRGSIITELTVSVGYDVQVAAVNARGRGGWSGTVSIDVSGTTVVQIGSLNLRFDWADPELPADLIMTRSYINESLFNNDRYLADALSAVPANGVAITDSQGRPVSLPLREGWVVVGGASGPMALEVPRFGTWRLGTVSGSPAWVEVVE